VQDEARGVPFVPPVSFANPRDAQALETIDTELVPALEAAMFGDASRAEAIYRQTGHTLLQSKYYGFLAPKLMLGPIVKTYGQKADKNLVKGIVQRLLQDRSPPRRRWLPWSSSRAAFLGGSSPSISDFALFGLCRLGQSLPEVAELREDFPPFNEWHTAMTSAYPAEFHGLSHS